METNISVRNVGGAIFVETEGDIDMASAPMLREHLLSALLTEPASPVVLDLTNTQFMDSSGLGALAEAHNVARDAGRRLLVAGAQRPVRRVLEITRMDHVLDCYADRRSALQALPTPC